MPDADALFADPSEPDERYNVIDIQPGSTVILHNGATQFRFGEHALITVHCDCLGEGARALALRLLQSHTGARP